LHVLALFAVRHDAQQGKAAQLYDLAAILSFGPPTTTTSDNVKKYFNTRLEYPLAAVLLAIVLLRILPGRWLDYIPDF
jgi:hypothetical protein